MGGATSKGVRYKADGSLESCLFCDIAANVGSVRETEVLFEDDQVVVFLPREVLASTHYLVGLSESEKGRDGLRSFN